MAITYPLDLLADFPGWSTEFDLLWRQEQSRQANGVTRVKDLGSPLWRASYQSRSMKPNELDHWRARLDALENGLQTFIGYSTSRCFPIAYPNGSWPTGGAFNGQTAEVYSIGPNRKSIAIASVPAAFTLQVGDMVSIGPGNLHRVEEAAVSGEFGQTSLFEIRPHLWPATVAGNTVYVKRPYCIMAVVPGSISSTADASTGRGIVSFQAVEAR